MESNRRVLTTEEMVKFQEQEYKELIEDFARDLLSTVNGYPFSIHFTRLFATISSYQSNESKRDIMPKIIAEIGKSNKPADQIYAAVALWNLRNKMSLEDNVQKHYDFIIEALSDEKISLACMNAIFKHFSVHNYSYLHELRDAGLQKLLFPTDHPAAWLRMVERLQAVAETKLTRDVGVLENSRDKLALLEAAEQMEVFKTANHNHAIGSLFSRKSSVSTIQNMIQQLHVEPAHKPSVVA